MGGKSAMGSQLDTFRETRRDIEASVLPLATSVDGRRFSFQASLHGLELQAGGYAVLDDGGTRRLGQVLSVELHQQLAGELTLPSVRRWPGDPHGTPDPCRAGRGNHRGRQQRAVPRRADPPGRRI